MNNNFLQKKLFVKAKPENVYLVLCQLDKWNQWTKSINQISIENNDSLQIGARIKVLQPKLPVAIWTVTEIKTNQSLTWQKKSFGLTLTAKHLIETSDDGSVVTLQMLYEGFLAGIFFKLTSALTNKYLTMEINGLKERCEKYL